MHRQVQAIDGRAVEITDDEKGATWWYHRADGGGALLDYCCYGACLARYLVGKPADAATGYTANLASKYGDAEDNAVITVRFPDANATKSKKALRPSWSEPNLKF